MEFNLGPSEKGDREKLERYGMRDWSRYIRLKQREVETRVVPNDEIIDAVCESELPSAGKALCLEVVLRLSFGADSFRLTTAAWSDERHVIVSKTVAG